MQRTHSLTSISSASTAQSRLKNTDASRQDLSTESLLSDATVFARRSRKPEVPGTRVPAFNFPNGEVFTPRTAPQRRARPARLATDNSPRVTQTAPHQNHQSYSPRLPRSTSMVSVPVVANTIYESVPQSPLPGNGLGTSPGNKMPGSFITRSHSFNNLRQKSKQELVHSLRNTKMDTPTNINVAKPAAQVPQNPVYPRSFSLTNNRYAQNATNIVRSESLLSSAHLDPVAGHSDRVSRSDSSPSSESNYNLNRSNSNTPQTSVSGSEAAPENAAKVWSSSESVSSFRTARDPSPLSSIEESVDANDGTAPRSKESPSLPHVSGRRSQYGDSSSSSPSSFENAPVFRFQGEILNEDTEAEQTQSRSGSSDELPSRGDIVHGPAEERPHVPLVSEDFSNESSIPSVPSNSIPEGGGDAENISHQALAPDSFGEEASSNLTLQDNQSASIAASVRSQSTLGQPQSQAGVQTEQQDPKNIELGEVLESHVPKDEATARTPESATSEYSELGDDLHKDTKFSPSETVFEDAAEHTTSKNNSQMVGSGLVTLNKDNNVTPTAKASVANADETYPSPDLEDEIYVNDVIETFPGGLSDIEPEEREVHPEDVIRAPPMSSLLQRRNLGIMPILTPSHSNVGPETSPEAPTPISKDSIRPTKSDSDLPGLVDSLKEQQKSSVETGSSQDISEVNDKAEDVSTILRAPADEERTIIQPGNQGAGASESILYSPLHVDRFLTDCQEAVPPRGDVAVTNGAIKVHKRDTSSISSINSPHLRGPSLNISPREPNFPHNFSPKVPRSTEATNSPPKSSIAPPGGRYSMLAVVDVDYDKLLPPTPKRDFFSKEPLHELQSKEPPKSEKTISPKRAEDLLDTSSTKTSASRTSGAKGIKKLFKFMKSGSKATKDTTPKLRWKSSLPSLRTSISSVDRKGENNQDGIERQMPPKGPEKKKKLDIVGSQHKVPGTKKREFLSNLKLTTGFKVYDLPSPVYSVRERTSSPDRLSFNTEEMPRFDLPEYNVEGDSFDDVLLRFQEVEKEIENEVLMVTKNKGIHDFFLKDDELSKAQIFDQQKKDIHFSSESLPGKLNSQNNSATNFDTTDSDCANDSQESLGPRIDQPSFDFPQNNDKRTLTLHSEQVSAALSEHDTRRSYLKYVRQFSDFDEIQIELSGFDPTQSAHITLEPRQKVSSLSKGATKEPRNVKFSNSISISETYAPHLYKRNNKSVTQYYLTEFSQINRIKNELNAYKCYEMLVHEKSQTNTHFFY